MAEPTKDELIHDAEGVGIDTTGLTKAELKDELEVRAPAELGPPVDAPAFHKHGNITGVQPMTADEIPESGR